VYIDRDGKINVIKDPTQIHHVASDKDSNYTAIFVEIFEKANMTLQNPENLISIEGHRGAHGPDYHRIVLARLNAAVKDKKPYSPEYIAALKEALRGLKQDITRKGSTLNDLVTGK
jgi:hypothetical protein